MSKDHSLVVWWGSTIECFSAFARLRRDRIINTDQEHDLRARLLDVNRHWIEIQLATGMKAIAHQLLLMHTLSASGALQLAAALVWADKLPSGHRFVCLDSNLRRAARREGFVPLP